MEKPGHHDLDLVIGPLLKRVLRRLALINKLVFKFKFVPFGQKYKYKCIHATLYFVLTDNNYGISHTQLSPVEQSKVAIAAFPVPVNLHYGEQSRYNPSSVFSTQSTLSQKKTITKVSMSQ